MIGTLTPQPQHNTTQQTLLFISPPQQESIAPELMEVHPTPTSSLQQNDNQDGENNNMTTKINCIYCYLSDITESMLEALVTHNIFNVYLSCGYPNPAQYPALTGIVPAEECGVTITEENVTNTLALMATVDERFKLWAWFGTWSNEGEDDAEGHALAQVDISTAGNRTAIITVLATIAQWGFYGVADDTEDINEASQTETGQMGDCSVAFWNSLASTLTGLGIKMSAYTPAVWYNFNMNYVSQLTGQDYLIMVGPNDATYTTRATEFLTHTSLPVIPYIIIGGSGDMNTVTGHIEALPIASYPEICGYVLYTWDSVTDGGEWTEWDAWTPKNNTSTTMVFTLLTEMEY